LVVVPQQINKDGSFNKFLIKSVHVAQHEHRAKQHLRCDTLQQRLSDPFLERIAPFAVTVTVVSVGQGDMNTRKK